MAARDEEFVVDQGSPFAEALAAARAAFERRDIGQMDRQYARAVPLAGEPNLRTAIAVEHVSSLRSLNDSGTASRRCAEYLAEDGASVRLLLQRAETAVVRDDFSRLDADLAEIREHVDGQPLGRRDEALLNRLDGIAADRNGGYSAALAFLRKARDEYRALRDAEAVDTVEQDIHDVRLHRGDVSDPAARSGGTSPQARFNRAEELRVFGRYQDAIAELDAAFEGPLDPAIRFRFLEAKVRLLRLLRATEDADELMDQLREAASDSARPEQNRQAADRLDRHRAPEFPLPLASEDRLQDVRHLVMATRLDEAEGLLRAEPAPAEANDRHAAAWHLAAGELTKAIADTDGAAAAHREAAAHFRQSVRHATGASLVAIAIPALRQLGDTHKALGEMEHACSAWAGAHQIEEGLANLQRNQVHRIRMLGAAADEFDERIKAADEAIARGERSLAVLAVAMEAARGSAILPDPQEFARNLPSPSDVGGSWRWIRMAARRLPRSQVIWMMHATPDVVHHVFIGRWTLRHRAVPCARAELVEWINALKHCPENRRRPEDAMARMPDQGARDPERPALAGMSFDRLLDGISTRLGLPELWSLHRSVRRIAVVAGAELAEIPVAALPCPGRPGTRLGRHYALSDLPCVSLRHPLRLRSRTQRGMTALLVQGPEIPTEATPLPGREVIHGEVASRTGLEHALATGDYRQVRIDSHAHFTDDESGTEAAIHLRPSGPAGWVDPDELQAMSWSATGTLLLGSCESGMARRNERDERTGFVRAALLSGVSAVLAARYEVLDYAAARMLDRFERYLRKYPRDVALFRAIRDEDAHDLALEKSPATAVHPALWAAWTLYGDPGYQTARGPFRRWLVSNQEQTPPTASPEAQ